jgi:hypothetical protein
MDMGGGTESNSVRTSISPRMETRISSASSEDLDVSRIFLIVTTAI